MYLTIPCLFNIFKIFKQTHAVGWASLVQVLFLSFHRVSITFSPATPKRDVTQRPEMAESADTPLLPENFP